MEPVLQDHISQSQCHLDNGQSGGGAEQGRKVSPGLRGREEDSAGDERIQERDGVTSPLAPEAPEAVLMPLSAPQPGLCGCTTLQTVWRFHLTWGGLYRKEVKAKQPSYSF